MADPKIFALLYAGCLRGSILSMTSDVTAAANSAVMIPNCQTGPQSASPNFPAVQACT
jgi:hypothetical protein